MNSSIKGCSFAFRPFLSNSVKLYFDRKLTIISTLSVFDEHFLVIALKSCQFPSLSVISISSIAHNIASSIGA